MAHNFSFSYYARNEPQCTRPRWPNIQKPRATFLTVFLQRATSCTRFNDRMNITPPLTHTHINTYLCSARFIVNVALQHDNDRNLQAIYYHAYYLVSGNSGIPFL